MAVTIDQIEEHLKQLSPEKLAVVYDVVSFLLEREESGALQTAVASEKVLRRDWDKPEEEAAWAHS
ncbi:MAG: hypothetical protein IVW51_15270 [Thermaceae bacterium]|nr:hypothetical protein [Thermaceae bacterium]